MKKTANTQQPSVEELRGARHRGFVDATAYMPDATRNRVQTAYAKQDARRENNVRNFVDTATGKGG